MFLPDRRKAFLMPNSTTGFTLVETLVAISILLLAVTAPLTIAYQGIASTSFVRDQIIATYLAQDAIEAIITQKRQNSLLENNWLEKMNGSL